MSVALLNNHQHPWCSQLLSAVHLAFSGSNACPGLICFSSSKVLLSLTKNSDKVQSSVVGANRTHFSSKGPVRATLGAVATGFPTCSKVLVTFHVYPGHASIRLFVHCILFGRVRVTGTAQQRPACFDCGKMVDFLDGEYSVPRSVWSE